ncbi:MAG: 50S ribosomal protein L11 methyltransferase [Aeromicrobium sp.]
MSSSELIEHAGYFRDARKLSAYQQAIDDVVRPGDVVVDLGAGTGLLGLMAARAGAARVYMVDWGSILGPAQEIAARNGYADRMIPMRGSSTDVELPELADVVICDQIGGFVYDAGVLEYFEDARRRLLKPDGTLMPGAFTLHLAPVSAPEARADVDIWAGDPAGFDTSAVHRLAINTEWRIEGSKARLSAIPATVASLEASSLDPVASTVSFTLDQPMSVDGLLGWFDAELAPGVHLTNAPDSPERMQRWCNFYPVERPLDVKPGDTLTATIDLRPRSQHITWSVEWARDGSSIGRWRHSTLLGQFLAPDDLARVHGATALEMTPQGVAVAAALSRVDGRTSMQDIITAVLDEHPDAFLGSSRAQSTLERSLAKWTRVSP